MLIMSFVFSNILRITNLLVPYPIFLYAGLLPWTFFSLSLTSAMGVFIENSSLIKKIYFPREVLVLSTILAKTFDFFLSLILFFVLMIYFRLPLTFSIFFFIPIFLIQFLFTYSLALILSALNLFYRDIQYLFNLVLSLWFYATPVIYATEFFPEKYQFVFKLNPIAIVINGYRKVLLGGNLPNFFSLGLLSIISLIFFLMVKKLFKKLEKGFADVV